MGAGLTRWAVSAYLSGLLSLATLAGNAALFAVHPATHWPALESLEALETASMIPVSLALHVLNRSSRLSAVITGVGIVGMLLGLAIDAAFASGLLAFGNGPVAVAGLGIAVVGVIVWLLVANVLAWRARVLPRCLALLGIASGLTVQLLYPAWALGLGRALGRRATG